MDQVLTSTPLFVMQVFSSHLHVFHVFCLTSNVYSPQLCYHILFAAVKYVVWPHTFGNQELQSLHFKHCTASLTEYHSMRKYHVLNCEYIWGNGGITPCSRNFGTRWKWGISLLLQLLYTQGKRHQYLLDRRPWGKKKKL